MKLFVMQYVDSITLNYHAGGGVNILARDEPHARELIGQYITGRLDSRYANESIEGPTEVDWENATVLEVGDHPDFPNGNVWIFPAAGCC